MPLRMRSEKHRYTSEYSIKSTAFQYTNPLILFSAMNEAFSNQLTLPTAKAGGFLLQPLLHWKIPCGISMSYTVSTSWIILFPYALRCSLICIYLFMLTAFAILYSRCLCLHWYLCYALYDSLDTPIYELSDFLPVDSYIHNKNMSGCLDT